MTSSREDRFVNVAQLAMERLAFWPDLHGAVPACGAGPALCSGEAEIVHFHGECDADLQLTAGALQRLRPELSRSTAIRLHPGSPWVTVHLDCEDDITLLTSLVSVALQAHASVWPRPAARLCSLCRPMAEQQEKAEPSTPRARRRQRSARRVRSPGRLRRTL